jgi:hypothetical protein
VRLLDGHIPPHDTTKLHRHSANSVIVFLSKSVFGIDIPGEPSTITSVNAGDTRYAAYADKPVTHRVWNQGDSMFHFVVIELLRQIQGNDSCTIPIQPGIRFNWQQKSVSVYHVDLASSEHYHFPNSKCAYLLIDISGIITAVYSGITNQLEAGGFIFFPSQSNGIINGSNKENASCILLELK